MLDPRKARDQCVALRVERKRNGFQSSSMVRNPNCSVRKAHVCKPMKIQTTKGRTLLAAAVVAAVSVVLYRRYHPELQARWLVWEAINDTLDSWRRLAGVSKAVLKDASEYIEGTTAHEDIPRTLQRLGSLASSPQAVHAAATIIRRVLYDSPGPSFLEKVLEVAVTEQGQQLIGATTTKAVFAFFSAYQETSKCSTASENTSESKFSELVDKTLAWAATPTGQPAAGTIMASFMAAVTDRYLDRSTNNRSGQHESLSFDALMQAVSKPEHLKAAQKLVSTFASTSVNSVLKSSRSRRSAARLISFNAGTTVLRAPLQELPHGGRQTNQHNLSTEESMNSSFAPVVGATLPNSVEGSVGGTAGESDDHVESQFRTVISDVVVRACRSREVRATCVAMARAGCAGAADATWVHVKHASAEWQSPARIAHWLHSISVAWMLLLSLWCLHVLVLLPAQDL